MTALKFIGLALLLATTCTAQFPYRQNTPIHTAEAPDSIDHSRLKFTASDVNREITRFHYSSTYMPDGKATREAFDLSSISKPRHHDGPLDGTYTYRKTAVDKATISQTVGAPATFELLFVTPTSGRARIRVAGSLVLTDFRMSEIVDPALKALLSKSPKNISPEELMTLAKAYEQGGGVWKNPKKAFGWMEKSSEAGNVDATFELGKYYWYGLGVRQNQKKAVPLFESAAQAGSAAASLALGQIYFRGEGLAKDDSAAFRWFTQAAKAGLPAGMFSLGYCYEFGVGTSPDLGAAYAWQERAANAGQREATAQCGKIILKRNPSTEEEKQALGWFTKAATMGDPESAYIVGVYFDSGKVVEQNTTEAITWYRRAAAAGHKEAAKRIETLEAPQRQQQQLLVARILAAFLLSGSDNTITNADPSYVDPAFVVPRAAQRDRAEREWRRDNPDKSYAPTDIELRTYLP